MKAPRRDAGLEVDVRRMAGTWPFDQLPREALQLLAFSCQKRALAEGDALFGEDEPADGAYFVLDGEITLTRRGAERRVRAGALISETALITETQHGAAARATAETRVLEIPRDTFRRVISEFPASAAAIKKSTARRLAKLLSQLEDVRAREFDV